MLQPYLAHFSWLHPNCNLIAHFFFFSVTVTDYNDMYLVMKLGNVVTCK